MIKIFFSIQHAHVIYIAQISTHDRQRHKNPFNFKLLRLVTERTNSIRLCVTWILWEQWVVKGLGQGLALHQWPGLRRIKFLNGLLTVWICSLTYRLCFHRTMQSPAPKTSFTFFTYIYFAHNVLSITCHESDSII